MKDIIINATWNIEVLDGLVSDDIAQKILHTSLSLYGDTSDQITWQLETNGMYTAASGYKWLTTGGSLPNNGADWNWVWKARIPEKFKDLF